MTNKTAKNHVFIDWTISTSNITDNSHKRWQVLCINNNRYYISFDRLQRPLSHSFAIFISMWKTVSYPLHSVQVCMIYNAQPEVRITTPKWSSSGWFKVTASCCPKCHTYSEDYLAKKAGMTSSCYRSLPDQWGHLHCQYLVCDP